MPAYLISMGQAEMLALADGDDAVDAVEQYCAGLDAYCPPSDELSEEAKVSALLVPDEWPASRASSSRRLMIIRPQATTRS